MGMRRTVLLMASTALAVLLILHTNVASAQSTTAVAGTTITVNSKGDGKKTGNCTLREAIEAANTNAKVDRCAAGSATERDAIHYSLGDKATIVLGSQLPNITDSAGLTINGLKAKITVSGNDSVRVFWVDSGAKLTLANLTVADGLATYPEWAGAGLYNNHHGAVKVINSTFSNNTATTTGGDPFTASHGGGIFNRGKLTVTNSTFSGNSAAGADGRPGYGGGIANDNGAGTATVTNSTFWENRAATSGGAIMTDQSSTTMALKNTIVANTLQGESCYGSITDEGYNIEDNTTCGFSKANNSMPATNPLLYPYGLADNGGPTKTIALLKGSPAINAIRLNTNECGTEVTTDQRGVERPQGNKCDIGALESNLP
jgi:CSLREA domain-containing protein